MTTPPTSVELVSISCADGNPWSSIPSTLDWVPRRSPAWASVLAAGGDYSQVGLIRSSCTNIKVTAALLDLRGRMMPGRYIGTLVTLGNKLGQLDPLVSAMAGNDTKGSVDGSPGADGPPTGGGGTTPSGTVVGIMGMQGKTGPDGKVSWTQLTATAQPGVYVINASLGEALGHGIPKPVSQASKQYKQ